MASGIEELRKQREKSEHREQKVEKLIREKKIDLDELAHELRQEREERDDLIKDDNRLTKNLEKEIRADAEGKGEKPESWEIFIAERLDEVADLYDRSQARSNRLIEKIADTRERRQDLVKRDKDLEQRIDRIEKRIKRKAEDRAGDLTEHFHVAEFDCHNGAAVPNASVPALKALCENYLEPLWDESSGSVHINSGFRTYLYNRSIGGASLSIHVYDGSYQHAPFAVAGDHTAAGMSPGAVQSFHNNHTHPDGMGYYSSFTHIDNRNRIGWADSRWNGP